MYLVRNPTKGGYSRAPVGGGFYPKEHRTPAQTDKRVKEGELTRVSTNIINTRGMQAEVVVRLRNEGNSPNEMVGGFATITLPGSICY
jgi:hypothetical protein